MPGVFGKECAVFEGSTRTSRKRPTEAIFVSFFTETNCFNRLFILIKRVPTASRPPHQLLKLYCATACFAARIEQPRLFVVTPMNFTIFKGASYGVIVKLISVALVAHFADLGSPGAIFFLTFSG